MADLENEVRALRAALVELIKGNVVTLRQHPDPYKPRLGGADRAKKILEDAGLWE